MRLHIPSQSVTLPVLQPPAAPPQGCCGQGYCRSSWSHTGSPPGACTCQHNTAQQETQDGRKGARHIRSEEQSRTTNTTLSITRSKAARTCWRAQAQGLHTSMHARTVCSISAMSMQCRVHLPSNVCLQHERQMSRPNHNSKPRKVLVLRTLLV